MAKRIVDEEMKFDIIINGNSAQKELFALEKSTRKLTEENKALSLQKKLLEKQNKQETEEYKTLTKTIRDNNREIRENKAKMAELQNQIGLTGLTMGQLSAKATQLKMALRNLVPGSADYEKYKQELADVKARMDELNGKSEETGFSLGSIADRFNRYAALAATFVAAVSGVVLSLQKVIDFNAKMSDAMTNVQKTTGMAKYEVEELGKYFGMLRTRTSRIELFKIAEVGGRLGVAKEEIADFVRVMDKSAVALGDSFEGGPEVVAEKLGKIKGLYEELKNVGVEEAFESVGSALNDLGAEGIASENNVAEFVSRVGTMPGALKPSIQQALGLGAAFEEAGLKAEIAGNNYSKVIAIAARDTSAFATVMQRPKKELENLINTNPSEFFFQFAQSLKGLDATDLAKVLDYLKLNDNEVKMVIGAASDNVQLFRDKIESAGKSMKEATSLTNEFDLKNNNLAATLERLQKKIMSWFTSDSVSSFLESAVNGLAKLVGAIEDSEGTMNKLKSTLGFAFQVFTVLTASLVSYTLATKLATLWSNNFTKANLLSNIVAKAQAFLFAAQRTAVLAYTLVMELAAGNIKRATVAYRTLAIAMGMNPFGALVALVTAVVVAFKVFNKEIDAAAEKQKLFGELHLTAQKAILAEKNEIDRLRKVAQDERLEKEKRLEAIKKLNDIIPDYIGKLTLENIKTKEGQDLLRKYTDELYRNARAKAAVAKYDELAGKMLEEEAKTSKDYDSYMDKAMNFVFGETNAVKDRTQVRKDAFEIMRANGKVSKNALGEEVVPKKEFDELVENMMKGLGLDQKEAAIKAIDNQMKELQAEIMSADNLANTVLKDKEKDLTKSSVIVPEKSNKAANKERERLKKEREEQLKDLKKFQEEVNDLNQRIQDERIDMMTDGFEKEEAIEAENHKKRIAELRKQMVLEADILKLDAAMDSEKTSPVQKAVLKHTKETWLEKNKQLNVLIELEQGRHELAVDAITQKAEFKRIADLQETYEKETMARQTAHNYELAALGQNAIAKEKLQLQFDKAELDKQREHLEKLLAEKERIFGDKNNNADFDLLTPEQKQELEQQIAELKLKISEVVKAKSDLSGKSGSDDFKTASLNAFGDTDVLGFSIDQWNQTFANLDSMQGRMEAVKVVTQGLQNIWSTYANFVTANENAQLAQYEKNSDAKKRKLKYQLDNGYINQAQYKKRLEVMDAELDKKKADLEYKQAKRQKQMAIVDAIINTAKGVTAALGMAPPASFIFAALAAATGALQIATISKQPLPARGYEEGLYPEYVQREQDGKVFKSTYGGRTKSGIVKKPTYFLAGENGPEMIIDSKAYSNLSPETRNALENELRRIKGFENGYYNNNLKEPRYEVPADSGNGSAAGSARNEELLMSVIERNTAVLEKIYNEGVVAFYNKNPRDLKDMMDDMDRITNSKNKAKN